MKYIIIREENVYLFKGAILNRMAKHYKAKVLLMRKEKELSNVSIELNQNLSLFQYAIMSPALARKKSGNKSAIFLSTRDNFLEHVPTIDRKARAMIGLGLGPFALYVEVKDKRHFEVRNLTTNHNKCYDLGLCFTPNSTTKASAVSTTFGDLHEYTHDKQMLSKFVRHAKKVGSKEINLHDVFDAISINHHELDSSLFIAGKIASGVSLKAEVDSLYKTLKTLSSKFSKINVVESNHDNFLMKVIKDNEKLEKTAELDKILLYELKIAIIKDILAKKKSVPALQKLITMHHSIPSNIKFINEEEVVTQSKFVISMHGDKGSNGARFNYKTATIPMSVTGHTHVGGYKNNNFSVGHCTDLSKQKYARGGLSSWTYSVVDIYPNQTAQLITFF